MDNQFCLRTAGVYVGKFPQPMSLRKLQKKKNAACVITKINLLFKKWSGMALIKRTRTTYVTHSVNDLDAVASWLVCSSPGGVLPETFGRGVRPASQNPYPIYDQNLRFSLPYL